MRINQALRKRQVQERINDIQRSDKDILLNMFQAVLTKQLYSSDFGGYLYMPISAESNDIPYEYQQLMYDVFSRLGYDKTLKVGMDFVNYLINHEGWDVEKPYPEDGNIMIYFKGIE